MGSLTDKDFFLNSLCCPELAPVVLLFHGWAGLPRRVTETRSSLFISVIS